MDFVEECKNLQARNAPVEAAIMRHAENILRARAQGVPLNVIYRALKAKDDAIGKGYSSFRQAFVRLDKRGLLATSGTYFEAAHQSSPSADEPLQNSPNPDRFGDKSRTSAF